MASVLEVLPAGTTLTITLASLATGAARQSISVDNTSNLLLDYFIVLQAKNHATSAPTGQKCINLYVGGTVDAGTTWTESATASGGATTDAAITLSSPPNIKLLGQLFFSAAAQTKVSPPFSVAAAFGGAIPAKFFLVAENQTGFTLDGTAADAAFAKQSQGLNFSVA